MAGVVATRIVPGYASKLFPISNPWMATALQAATAIVGGQLVGQFTRRQLGEDFALCGLVMVADDLAQLYLYPNMGLGAYMNGNAGVGAYLDQYLSPGATVGALPSGSEADWGSAGLPARLDSRQRL